MILELVIARGTKIVIDGQKPAANWSRGEEEETADGRWHTEANVTIGEHTITGWSSNKPLECEWEGRPRSLTLHTTNGDIRMRVASCRTTGTVTLTSGDEVTLDEYTLYLRAETTKKQGS